MGLDRNVLVRFACFVIDSWLHAWLLLRECLCSGLSETRLYIGDDVSIVALSVSLTALVGAELEMGRVAFGIGRTLIAPTL